MLQRYFRKSSQALKGEKRKTIRLAEKLEKWPKKLAFVFGIDGHFESVLSKVDFGNIDPLAICSIKIVAERDVKEFEKVKCN